MEPAFNMLSLLVPVCVVLPIILIGGGLLYFGLKSRRQAAEAANWPAAVGRVRNASIQHHIHRSGRGVHHSYEPVIEYEYDVAGTIYQGNRVAFGASGVSQKSAEDTLAHFTPGSQISVYYNSQNPAEAVLERQAKGGTLMIIIGGLFLGVSLVFLCVGGVLVLIVFASQAGV